MLIDGIHIPLTAPFYRDGRSYLRKLEHNVGRYSLTPAAGFVALGPGGEGNTLSDAETIETLTVIAQTAAKEKVLVAGIAKDSVRGALAIADAAAGAGFDAVMLAAPGNWLGLMRHNKAQVGLFFRAVADASPLPVMLWSGAAQSGFELPVEFAAELALHPNILGLYDAGLTVGRHRELAALTAGVQREVTVTTVFAPVTGRMLAPETESGGATFVSAVELGGGSAVAVAPAKPSLKTRTKKVGFQVMAAGSSVPLVPLLEAGVAGAMPRLAASAPQACFEVYAAFKDGDPALSAEKAERLVKADALVGEKGVAAVKYGCDLNGYYGGWPRLPVLPLDAAEQAAVAAVMRELRN